MVNQLAELHRVFYALADPTRQAIVERLARGPASVKTIASPFPVSLPAVMKHIQILEDSGIVATSKVGRVRTCQLSPRPLREAERWLSLQHTVWDRDLDRLTDHLAQGQSQDTTINQGDDES